MVRARKSLPWLVMCLVVVSCTSPIPGSAVRGDPGFAVASGKDGVAMIGPGWFEPVPALACTDPRTGCGQVWSTGLSATSAAVVANGHIAVVRAHEPAIVKDCADCSGVAVTSGFIVTSRKNYQPDNGIEILLFSRDLASSKTVAAQRLEERTTTNYDAENTQSPMTLAADSQHVTLGYMAREGGSRRGPTVIARYDLGGKLLRHNIITGRLDVSVVSVDGNRLGVGVGGSGGACVTVSAAKVIDLQTLDLQPIEPAVPGSRTSTRSWFMLTDLHWRGDVLTATGEVHDPPRNETCDPDPEVWRRSYDTAKDEVRDTGGGSERARRWVGPGCDDFVETSGRWDTAQLVRHSGGATTKLGGYARIGLGRPAPDECGPA